MIELTKYPIDTSKILAAVASPDAGATVLFLGTTRRTTDHLTTELLTYTAYEPMARAQMAQLEVEARRRWPLQHCVLVHRLGEVAIGEASVAVAVSSGHRRAAFEAASWLIDILKETVPVWKREHWNTGRAAWVHPGLERSSGDVTP